VDLLPSSILYLTFAALLVTGVGVFLATVPRLSRHIVPFSGALLLAIALFWTLPELGQEFGWLNAVAWLALGIALLYFIDRFVYPVCPSCSPSHDHEHCATRLHGFGPPVIAAAFLHSMLDGWTVLNARAYASVDVGSAILAGVLVHKLPEALAFGVILRAALRSRGAAFGWSALVQSGVIFGALFYTFASGHLSQSWLQAIVALAAGAFAFLGFHAVHSEWKRRAAAALQQDARVLLR
jgi:zinc transporter ZupT